MMAETIIMFGSEDEKLKLLTLLVFVQLPRKLHVGLLRMGGEMGTPI